MHPLPGFLKDGHPWERKKRNDASKGGTSKGDGEGRRRRKTLQWDGEGVQRSFKARGDLEGWDWATSKGS